MINASHPGNDLPRLQIWRPSSLKLNVYNRIGQLSFVSPQLIENRFTKKQFYFTYATSGDDQIEFQPGDVIGYYQPSNPRYLLWSIEEQEYFSYSNNASVEFMTYNTTNVDHTNNQLLPFARVSFGEYYTIDVNFIITFNHDQ